MPCIKCNKSLDIDYDEMIHLKDPNSSFSGDCACIKCAEAAILKWSEQSAVDSFLICREKQLEYLPYEGKWNHNSFAAERGAPTWTPGICNWCGLKWSTHWYNAGFMESGSACMECNVITDLGNKIHDIEGYDDGSTLSPEEKGKLKELNKQLKQVESIRKFK